MSRRRVGEDYHRVVPSVRRELRPPEGQEIRQSLNRNQGVVQIDIFEGVVVPHPEQVRQDETETAPPEQVEDSLSNEP